MVLFQLIDTGLCSGLVYASSLTDLLISRISKVPEELEPLLQLMFWLVGSDIFCNCTNASYLFRISVGNQKLSTRSRCLGFSFTQ